MKTRVWLFDIDGTLADCSHRLHHIQKNPKDWDRFYAECWRDDVIPHMIELFGACLEVGKVVFVTGRPESNRTLTETWLREEVGIGGPLYMRATGDHRHDDVVKIELLAKLREDGFEPIMAFEDRARVAAAWRAAGVPCAHIAEGNF